MRFKRSQRVSELIHEEISSLLISGLKDPRIGFATLTRVDVTNDLKHATVYVSVMGTDEDKETGLKGLNSATGYIRKTIGRGLRLKRIPDLLFRIDDSLDYSIRINKILSDIKEEQDAGQPFPEASDA